MGFFDHNKVVRNISKQSKDKEILDRINSYDYGKKPVIWPWVGIISALAVYLYIMF